MTIAPITQLTTSSNEDLEMRLRAIADSLEVPASAYEQATNRYNAVGDWLCADDSPLQQYNPRIYAQGSFALGTVIRPYLRTDYDIDAVVLLDGSPRSWTPEGLKNALGDRLRAHKTYKRMLGPEGRRCWTLEYASSNDEPGFHMDLLASVLDAGDDIRAVQRTTTAIAITNRINLKTYNWRESDPKGYAAWFKTRRELERPLSLTEKRAHIERVPEPSARTSLQTAVQLLKRHRDVMFKGREEAPISVIITTLAARAYNGEVSLADAMINVTNGMRARIEWDDKRPIVSNPVRIEENFADRWETEPEKQVAFFDWLEAIERFVEEVANASVEELRGCLTVALGEPVADVAVRKYAAMRSSSAAVQMLASAESFMPTVPSTQAPVSARVPALWQSASHRQPLYWPEMLDGTRLRIKGRVTGGQGARIRQFQDGALLEPGANLQFEALYDERPGDTLYWQIVNTGEAAKRNQQLRGMFEAGGKDKREDSLYFGDHFIECFLIRNEACVARSGPFTVRVR